VDPGLLLGDPLDGGVVFPGAGAFGFSDGDVEPGLVLGFVEFGPFGVAGVVSGGAAPGAGEAVPGVGDAAPGVGEAVPGVGEAAPGVGDTAPGVGDALPPGVVDWPGAF
jgi:hypothetical protein